MQKRISPASSINGAISLPGDKSISHRYAMIAAIAEGDTRIRNYSTGADCHSTLGCVRALGIDVEGSGTEFVIHGKGLDGLRAPAADLDAGNSGSTIRMLSGILAAQPFTSRIFGDESLSRRPMQRIMKPLAEMGARIEAREDKFPPLEITGGKLRPIDYTLPVPSAQVKTCVLFAGLFAEGETSVTEPIRSRDHTEIALREFGADVARGPAAGSRCTGRPKLTGRELMVPSDLSSAAFFIVAALLAAGVAADDSRRGTESHAIGAAGFSGGDGRAASAFPNLESHNGELVGEILVEHSELRGGMIEGGLTAALIDEIPVLAVLGAATEEGHHGEGCRASCASRRPTASARWWRTCAAWAWQAEELPDGMVIPGRQKFHAADAAIRSAIIASPWRLRWRRCAAMANRSIDGAEAASVSFPEFWDTLSGIVTHS